MLVFSLCPDRRSRMFNPDEVEDDKEELRSYEGEED